MGEIRKRISEDLKLALKAKDETRISTLRMLKTEILKYETSENGEEINEKALLQILNTMKKQREESIEQFEKGERFDLAGRERKELAVVESYLPSPLSDQELEVLVEEAISETGARHIKEMGKIMKIAIAKAAGRADGKRISSIVRAKLTQ